MRSNRQPAHPGQSGFSMVELLMAAFVLAIGILGITMLQVMSLRTARGSQSLTTAVQVANRVMDQVELEGRLTWLNTTDTDLVTPGTLSELQYLMDDDVPVQTFNPQGEFTADAAVSDKTVFYTVNTTKTLVTDGASGRITDVTVAVQFADTVGDSNVPITRTVTLTRRIVHG